MPARLVSDNGRHVVDSAAGLRHRGRSARLHRRARAAGHRLLLPGVRRPRPAAAAHQAAADRARARASRRQELDAEGARQRAAAPPARSPAQPAGRAPRPREGRREPATPSSGRHAIVAAADVRAVVQRVSSARVRVDGAIVGEIGRGLLVLLGVARATTAADVAYIASKIRDAARLRMTSGEDEPRRRPTSRAGVLVVSQFTLLGDCRRGRRPSFIEAAPPEMANALYEDVVAALRASGLTVATGVFQRRHGRRARQRRPGHAAARQREGVLMATRSWRACCPSPCSGRGRWRLPAASGSTPAGFAVHLGVTPIAVAAGVGVALVLAVVQWWLQRWAPRHRAGPGAARAAARRSSSRCSPGCRSPR